MGKTPRQNTEYIIGLNRKVGTSYLEYTSQVLISFTARGIEKHFQKSVKTTTCKTCLQKYECLSELVIYAKTKIKSLKNRPYPLRIPMDYSPMKSLPVDIKFMAKGFDDLTYLFQLLIAISPILCLT